MESKVTNHEQQGKKTRYHSEGHTTKAKNGNDGKLEMTCGTLMQHCGKRKSQDRTEKDSDTLQLRTAKRQQHHTSRIQE